MYRQKPMQSRVPVDIAVYNSVRVRHDAEKSGKTVKSGLVWYSVPALSNIQRLPDQYPVDGQIFEPLRVVM